MRRIRGMTLIELLTVIAIAAILAMVAVPSFTKIIATQRLKSAASNLQIALLTARSEALKRNTTVCVSTSNTGCTSSSDWSQGWYVLNAGTVLGTFPAYSSLTINGPTTGVTFDSSGRISSTSTAICPATNTWLKVTSSSISGARYLNIAAMGAPSIVTSLSTDCNPS
jgi:type IV fimbrial biogenesis protein FimT